MTYIRLKNLAEKKKFNEIDDIIKKSSYKKLDITPLIVAKILYNAKFYDGAVKYINDVNEINDFEEKINLLKKMGKHKEALDIVMNADRKIEKQLYIDGILKERPDLSKCLKQT